MKRNHISILLVIIMIACFGVALSYPIQYFLQKETNETDMDDLRALRQSALDSSAGVEQPVKTEPEDISSDGETEVLPTGGLATAQAAIGDSEASGFDTDTEPGPAVTALPEMAEPEPTDRYYRVNNALPYPEKEKVKFDEDDILPQYREIYAQNQDLVGWIHIPGTVIDYPVLQNEVNDFYLRKDFYGKKNANGQIIMDTACDPWTPSYNLVISGHNMKSGKMFGSLANYASKGYWNRNKLITFDTLLREGQYVIFATFYSADYDEHEEGFRYNADIQYKLDFEFWMEEVEKNRLFETGVDVEFGDEILTLTTCVYNREDGRFVVAARRVREGEVIQK